MLAGRPARHLEGWVEVVAPVPASVPAPGPAAAATGDVVIRWVDRLGWRGLAAIAACLALIAVGAALLRRPPGMPVAAEPAATTPLIPAPARLEVSFRHPFRVGTLRVWVDGALALEETVPGRVTRDLLALKLRRGTFTGVLDVPPGEHVVRVQVDDGDGFRESRRIRATFASGQARRLDATVDGHAAEGSGAGPGPMRIARTATGSVVTVSRLSTAASAAALACDTLRPVSDRG